MCLSAGCEPSRSADSSDSPSESAESSASPETDQSRTGESENDKYALEVVPDPNPIPFQELFAFQVRIYESGEREQLAEQARIDQVRARMPAHDHGMKTEPEVVDEEAGVFRLEGMRFHMRGDGEDGLWVLELVINGPEGIDEASFEYQCCIEP